jgi:hypothetical protein
LTASSSFFLLILASEQIRSSAHNQEIRGTFKLIAFAGTMTRAIGRKLIAMFL